MAWGRFYPHSYISTSEFLSFTAACQYIDPRPSCAIRIAEQLFLMSDIMHFTSSLSAEQLKCAYNLSPIYCVTYSHVPGVLPQVHHRQLRSWCWTKPVSTTIEIIIALEQVLLSRYNTSVKWKERGKRKEKGKTHLLFLLSFHCYEPSEHSYSVWKEEKLLKRRALGFCFYPLNPNCQGISGEASALTVEGIAQ